MGPWNAIKGRLFEAHGDHWIHRESRVGVGIPGHGLPRHPPAGAGGRGQPHLRQPRLTLPDPPRPTAPPRPAQPSPPSRNLSPQRRLSRRSGDRNAFWSCCPEVEMPAIDRVIHELASSQHGAFSRAQARQRGITRQMLSVRLRRGDLRSLGQQVLVATAAPDTELLRATVATLVVPGAALSHRSAAAYWGLPGFRLEPLEILTCRPGRAVPHSSLARIHTTTSLPGKPPDHPRGVGRSPFRRGSCSIWPGLVHPATSRAAGRYGMANAPGHGSPPSADAGRTRGARPTGHPDHARAHRGSRRRLPPNRQQRRVPLRTDHDGGRRPDPRAAGRRRRLRLAGPSRLPRSGAPAGRGGRQRDVPRQHQRPGPRRRPPIGHGRRPGTCVLVVSRLRRLASTRTGPGRGAPRSPDAPCPTPPPAPGQPVSHATPSTSLP